MSKYDTAWDIYAEQLFLKSYGHPLWIPEPTERPLRIGDVGWMKCGKFRPLFNSMAPEIDPINALKGVPRNYETLGSGNILIDENIEEIHEQAIYSGGMCLLDTCGEVDGGSHVASAATSFRFTSTSDAGAFLLLEPPGVSHDIKSGRHIRSYMRDNFNLWLEFANSESSWGLGLKDEDLMFISGTIQTSRWVVVAFAGHNVVCKQGFVSTDFGPYTIADFSEKISKHPLPGGFYRSGPSTRPLTASANVADRQPPAKANQCIFIHYYKMKRRSSWARLRRCFIWANTALQILHKITSAYPSRNAHSIPHGYDPVTHLLEYILDNSEAKVAIASDMDLFAILKDMPVGTVNDIPAALILASPTVTVDEHGTGTVSTDSESTALQPNSDPFSNENFGMAQSLKNVK